MTTTEILNSTPDTFEHQIVTTESVSNCDCGGSHEIGDALWGAKIDPREYDTIGFKQVKDLHDCGVEYEHHPENR
jgi:hypothetical protein